MPRAGDNKPRRYRRERHTHTTPRRQLRSFAQGTPSFLPGGRKRQRALTQSHSTNETDTRPIYSHYRSPLAPYDLVVVLPLPRMGGRVLCVRGGREPRCQRLRRRRHTAMQRRELPRPVYCVLTYALALLLCCMCGPRTWLRVVSPSCLAKTMREIADV